MNGRSAEEQMHHLFTKSGSSTSCASFLRAEQMIANCSASTHNQRPKGTPCVPACTSRPMCQSHLHDGIEQTRNDAVGLGRLEIVLLDEGCDEVSLQNDVVLADGGAGREGGGGGGGAHGATWPRRAGTGGRRGGGGAGSSKAEHGFGSISSMRCADFEYASKAGRVRRKIWRPHFRARHFC